MSEVPAHVRRIYQEYLRANRGSDRAERWDNLLQHIEHVMPHGLRDHRGLQIAFEELERELNS